MSVSVSVNTSHVSYGVVYTVDYECDYTPFDIYLTLQVNSSSSRRMKYIAENLTDTWGSITFTVWASDVIAEMEDRGYPYPANTPTGIQVNVAPQDINAILNGHYAETGWLGIDLPATACTPPSDPILSVSQTTGSATLSWTAGGSGTNNAVTGYVITYKDSSNGSTWGEVNYLKEVTGTSTTVDAPSTTGYYRMFGIQTKGAAGDNYLSTVVWSGSLQKISYTACGAPTSFSCSPTLTDSTTTLSWSGATGGTANAIASYEIQYCESSDGSTWGSWTALTTVTSTATSGTKSVSASATYGNYRKFRIRTRGAAGSSYYSAWKESSNTVRRNHAAFGAWTDPTLTAGTTKVRAIHMTEMQERVNVLLAFYHKSEVSFAVITSDTTLLKNWTSHITELRNAIDQISTSHDTWITISENKPAANVVTQLRSIIMSL